MARYLCILALLALAGPAMARGGHCPLTGKGYGKPGTTAPPIVVRWRVATSLTNAVATGKAVDLAASRVAQQPMIVYICREDDVKAAPEVLSEGKVARASRFFDCIRIGHKNAGRETSLRKAASKAPRIVFLRPNFEVVAAMPVKTSAGKLFSAMRATIKKDYTNNVQAALKKQKSMRKEFLALDREKAKLASLDERIKSCNSEAKRDRLSKEREKLYDALDRQERELKGRDKALFALKRRIDRLRRAPQ